MSRPSRFLVVPGSFRGTLSSQDACRVISAGITAGYPDAKITTLPTGDGGGGTMDAMITLLGGDFVDATVAGPTGEKIDTVYAVLSDGTAVIEIATACGLHLATEGANPARYTTRGVGELMLDAARRGCTSIILGLGSCCTTDGGCGAAAACGVKFFDRYVEPFVPTGSTLDTIQSIDVSGLDPLLRQIPITTVCAVSNPLCGAMGTSATFAPGKGALPTVVSELDAGLAHMADVIKRDLGIDVLHMTCAGAGGGMGAGMAAFFGSEPRLGVDVFLDLAGFDELLSQTDAVITGEGRFDVESLHGKVVSGIARRCKQAGVPLVAVVGSLDETLVDTGHALGVTHFISISGSDVPLSQLTKHPRARLTDAVTKAFEKIAAGEELPLWIEPEKIDA